MADDAKRYRAYLTRLTKWVVFDEAKDRQINQEHMRRLLIQSGEQAEHLDDGWAKRVFGDAKMFEKQAGGFFRILDGVEQGKKPEWKGGARPGEDVAGNTLHKLVQHVHDLDEDPPWTSHRLSDKRWEPVSRYCISALNHMRTRGIERPMAPLQDRAFAESLRTDDPAHQTVALWLTTTRYCLDAYARVRAYEKGEGKLFWEGELELYRPTHFRAKRDPETGELAFIDEEFTVKVALEVIRDILVKRKILKEQRRAA